MHKSVTLKKWFHVSALEKKRSVPFLPSAAAMLCLAFSLPASANPIFGVTDNCTKGGIIIEKNFFGIEKHFIVNITDKEDGGKVVLKIDAGVIPAGGQVEVKVPPPGPGIDHCDAYNESEAVGLGGGGPGGVGAGAKQALKIEALFVDPITNQVIIGSIFDFVSQAYPGEFLRNL